MSNTDIPAMGSGGEWKEYRRLVLRDLERFEKQAKSLLDEIDKLRGDVIAIREHVTHMRDRLASLDGRIEDRFDAAESKSHVLEKRVAANETSLAAIQGRAAGLGAIGGGSIVAIAEIALRYLGGS